MLFSFLYRNLKGYRLLVLAAILITITQVGADIVTALPLKFIPSKVNNAGADPACTFKFLNPILDRFDTPQIDPTLYDPILKRFVPPADSPCPVSPTDLRAAAHPTLTHHSVRGVVVFSVLLLIVAGLISAVLVYLDLFLAAYIAQNLSARLRNELFDHLQRLSLDWHGKQKKGDLVQRITGNIADIEKLMTDGLVDLLAGVLTLIGVTVVMLYISPPYTLISLAIAPALFLIVLTYTKGIKAAARRASKAAGQVADVATEDMNALTVIKVFTREERESMRFGRYTERHRAEGLRASGLQAQFTPLVSVLVIVGTAIILGVGGFVAAGTTLNIGPLVVEAASIDIGTLVLFLIFLKLLYQPMRDLSKLANLANTASAGVERIQEVLDQAPEVVDQQIDYKGPQRLKGDIIFESVFFGYTKERPVLNGINLHIPAGRKIGLVGLSGGGKTTLVKLIPRFYEVQYGTVKIDGVDNRLYPLNVLRNNVSMVLQDSVLFEGTLRENICVGKLDASEEDIIEAAKKADIHETIMKTLGGYDRVIREQGKDLSGGQRQRIAIARAILRDAPILILDEPTAALDVEAESEVMHALNKLIVGRTVLTISHRLSTLGQVDEIIVLKEGRVVEQGTFQDLKRRGGIFAGLLEEQNRYNIEKIGEESIIRSAFVNAPIGYQQDYRTQRSAAVSLPSMMVGSQRQGAEANPPEARIFLELGGKVVSERRLDKPLLTIGRHPGNDIQISSRRVSRMHAKIHMEQGKWIIEDAESVNGIVYQGQRVEQHILSNGDKIALAPDALLHYKVGQG